MTLIVAFEGLPGTGKTTAAEKIVATLRSEGLQVGFVDIETIGDAPVLRESARKFPLGHPARILLFWVLRLQQFEMMQSLTKTCDIVIADRFWGSTIAFDVFGNKVPEEVVNWFGSFITKEPDITFLFDAPIDLIRKRKEAKTMKNPSFAERVYAGYKQQAKKKGWLRVDAAKDPETVYSVCLEVIRDHLKGLS